MANFAITSTVFTGQTLNAAETGFVASGGTIYASTGSAVVMNASSHLTILGDVVASLGRAISLNPVGTFYDISIGQAASVMSSAANAPAIGGAFSGSVGLRNDGLISGSSAISLVGATVSAQFELQNTGRIETTSFLATAAISVNSSGIFASYINNSGTISFLGGGSAILLSGIQKFIMNNSGTIEAPSAGALAITANSGLLLHNTGEILGGISIAGATSNITNSGTLDGNISLSAFDDHVVNTGTILGSINLSTGNNTFVNRGGVVTGTVSTGNGNDTFDLDTNKILILDFGGFDQVFASCDFKLGVGIEELQLTGPVGLVGIGNLGDNILISDVGNDSLRGGSGDDDLQGSDGDNRLQGGLGSDTLFGGSDNDALFGGAGDDLLVATLGSDTYDGGLGQDLLDFRSIVGGVKANLTTGVVSFEGGGAVGVTGLEDLFGTGTDDVLVGSTSDNVIQAFGGNDTLTGGGGNDMLSGNSGNDQVFGGNGNDSLTGGDGSDLLSGGAGADFFVYVSPSESDGSVTFDTITDFTQGSDVIDLSVIDADLATLGDQDFTFIGTSAFSGSAAQVRAVQDPVNLITTIEVRLAGAASDSMVIVLTGDVALTAADFIL